MFAFAPTAFSIQAFSPAAFAIDAGTEPPAVPPAPTFTTGAAGIVGTGRRVRPRYWRDDDLLWLAGGKR